MKRIILSILAVAALASCSKTESAYVDQDQEIKLNPVTAMTTKAYAPVYGAIDGTTYPTSENFGVVAYWNTDEPGAKFEQATTYLGADGAVEFTNKGLYWGGTTTYYWPKNGSLRFAAYSPYRVGNDKVKHTLQGDIYEIEFTQSTDAANTVDLLVAPTSESYNAETAAEKVSVVFEHTQSWITLKVKATEAADEAFTLTKLAINNLYTAGKLTAQMTTGKQSWDYTNEAENEFVVFSGSQLVTTEVATAENGADENGTLVLPQNTTSVTVTFNQNAEGNIPALNNQVLEIPLVLDTEHTPWEAGKHYIYTLIFDRDEILINPSVADWEEVYVNDIPATDNEVATAEEFVAAINRGGQIRLTNDITLENISGAKGFVLDQSTETNAKSNSNINIDLNGFTLTSKVQDILFRVNEGVTLTIGRGTIDAVDYIASANKGGTIVVNNGTYQTTEVTLFNANGGNIYVTGGKFSLLDVDKHEYGTKYMLNHIDNQKVNGLIEVTGGTFVNYNPAESKSENPVMNFVKAGYAVTVDENENYTVIPAANLVAGGEVTLASNVTLSNGLSVAPGVNAVINLNGKTITNRAENTDTDVFFVSPGAELTINGEGNVTAVSGSDGYPVYSQGKVTINGGSFVTGKDQNGDPNACIYVKYSGEAYINGGTFQGAEGALVINKHDQSRNQSVIEITGGEYYNFNPSNCASEGAGTNFVKEGYKVTESEKIQNGVLVPTYIVEAE